MILPESLLPKSEWKATVLSMPIPCVDVVVEKDTKVLSGFRTIRPYRSMWTMETAGEAV